MDTEEQVEELETGVSSETESDASQEGDTAKDKEEPERKLTLQVEITDAGPCKKHIKVEIDRADITHQFDQSLVGLRREAVVPGFRVGRAPKQLVNRRFKKEVAEKVKAELITASLKQLEEDHKLKAISQPSLDVEAIELPEDGPLKYELEVEVQPEFEVPDLSGLVVRRPIRAITDADIEAEHRRLMERDAQLVPKLDGGAELGDALTANITLEYEGVQFQTFKETTFRVSPTLRFPDGHVPDLDKVLVGARPGDHRTATGQISEGSADAAVRGKTIQVHFQVLDLKQLRLPEFDRDFLRNVGFDSETDYREALRDLLERRVAFHQRRAVRQSVLDQLHQRVQFDLPPDLVMREARAIRARILKQSQDAGANEQDLRAQEAEIRANALEVSRRTLKDFFLLAKIAEAKELKVEEADVEQEIEAIASRQDESPRRVRARIEKGAGLEELYQDILDRKVIDHILEGVKFEDVVVAEPAEAPVETLDEAVAPEPDEEEGASPEETAEAGQPSS